MSACPNGVRPLGQLVTTGREFDVYKFLTVRWCLSLKLGAVDKHRA